MLFRAQVSKAFNPKLRTLLSDGNGQQLHVVGAVATISARLGHRESICTSSAMCGRAAESVSAAAGSLAAVAAHLLLCPLQGSSENFDLKKIIVENLTENEANSKQAPDFSGSGKNND